MASDPLNTFLSGVDSAYLDYTDKLLDGGFRDQRELASAGREDLIELGIHKGPAGAA